MNITALIQDAVDRQRLPSDRQLSIALGVTRATISALRLGRAQPSPDLLARIAELAGADVAATLLEFHEERAASDTTKAIYADLRVLLKRSAAALIIGATALISLAFGDAHAAAPTGHRSGGMLYIMENYWRRVRAWLSRFLRSHGDDWHESYTGRFDGFAGRAYRLS